MSIFTQHIEILSANVVAQNLVIGRKIATAESCTGGLVSAAITEIAGSSAVFTNGYVTYSNQAKIEMLGVDADLIESFGAVSIAVAQAMAHGALTRSAADIAVAISGVAGPGGGSKDKPVGTVVFAVAEKGKTVADAIAIRKDFGSDKSRSEIRTAAMIYALELLLPPAP